MTTWFFFYQPEPEGTWFLSLSDQRSKIVRDKKPPFTTILDVDHDFEGDVTAEQISKAHYRGPFYIDLDSNDPEEVTAQFKKLLKKLVDDYEVDLHQLELYATGGRGYHITFHPSMFLDKLPPRGMVGLPLVYKEMANEMFVDTLDLNIYSMKRGRMFREPNVKRTNGNFKVRITVEEALAMTPELYVKVCSEPRHLPKPSEPTYHPELGLSFAKANGKVGNALKARKNAKADQSLLKEFGGKLPPTVSAVMNGESIKEGVGFQSIATQLAITAHAMAQTEDAFLDSCAGLIANHVGDSSRYGTPVKRKNELKRMYAYMAGNPCYTFSVGGIKSLLSIETESTDLDMGTMAPSEDSADGETQYTISQGIRITEQGIFRKTEEGLAKVSALGFTNPKQLLDINTGEVHGYEVDICVDGKKLKSRTMGMDAFQSRAQFLKFTLSAGSCNISLTDGQIGAIADIMRLRTEKSGQQVFTVRREGLDVIHIPGGGIDIVWADQFGVESGIGGNYRLTGSMTADLLYRTDLRQAPLLEDTEQTREFFDCLFEVNSISTVAKVFGFYLACFMSQPIRHIFNQFPFLQVYGQAGSGKSHTCKLFAQLHYYQMPAVVNSALDSTRFLYEEMASASGSMPFILDEFKPREMRKDIYEKAKGILRSNYNGDVIGKGSISNSTGQSKMIVTRVSNRAPIVVIGEAIIAQSALLERCVVVPMTKEGRKGQRDHFLFCQEHSAILGMLGRLCVDKARGVQFDGLRAQVLKYDNDVRALLGARADDSARPVFNVAVMLTGLEFGRRVMRHVFGDRYDFRFAQMAQSLTVHTEALIPRVMSEAAKVLNDISYLSKYGDDERYTVKSGEDYVDAGTSIFLRMKNVYTKYVRFKRSTGDEVLYDSYEAFYSAMTGYLGTIDTQCTANPLKDSPSTAVFEMDTAKLANDGVEDFKK